MPVAQQFTDSLSLECVETLVDIKGLGIGESSDYAFFCAEQGHLKPIDHRAVKVHKEHCKAAKDRDSRYQHTPDDELGPVKSALLSFGRVGQSRVHGFRARHRLLRRAVCRIW